jgi:hypothetical protein
MSLLGSKSMQNQASVFDGLVDPMLSLNGEPERIAVAEALGAVCSQQTDNPEHGISPDEINKCTTLTFVISEYLKNQNPDDFNDLVENSNIAKYMIVEDSAVLIFCNDSIGDDLLPRVYYIGNFDAISVELKGAGNDEVAIREVLSNHLNNGVEAITGSINHIGNAYNDKLRNAWVKNLALSLSNQFNELRSSGAQTTEGLRELGRRFLSQVHIYLKQGLLEGEVDENFEQQLRTIQQGAELEISRQIEEKPESGSFQGVETKIGNFEEYKLVEMARPSDDIRNFYDAKEGSGALARKLTALSSYADRALLRGKFTSPEAKESAENQFCKMLFHTVLHVLENKLQVSMSLEQKIEFCKTIFLVRETLDIVAHRMTIEEYKIYCLFLQKLAIGPPYQHEDMFSLQELFFSEGRKPSCNLAPELIQLSKEIFSEHSTCIIDQIRRSACMHICHSGCKLTYYTEKNSFRLMLRIDESIQGGKPATEFPIVDWQNPNAILSNTSLNNAIVGFSSISLPKNLDNAEVEFNDTRAATERLVCELGRKCGSESSAYEDIQKRLTDKTTEYNNADWNVKILRQRICTLSARNFLSKDGRGKCEKLVRDALSACGYDSRSAEYKQAHGKLLAFLPKENSFNPSNPDQNAGNLLLKEFDEIFVHRLTEMCTKLTTIKSELESARTALRKSLGQLKNEQARLEYFGNPENASIGNRIAIAVGSSRLMDFSTFLEKMPKNTESAIRIYFSRLSSSFTELDMRNSSDVWLPKPKVLQLRPSASSYVDHFVPKAVDEAFAGEVTGDTQRKLRTAFGERPMGATSLLEDVAQDLSIFQCGGSPPSTTRTSTKLLAFFGKLQAPAEGGKTVLRMSMESDPFTLLDAARKIYDNVYRLATERREDHPDVFAIAYASRLMSLFETEFAKMFMEDVHAEHHSISEMITSGDSKTHLCLWDALHDMAGSGWKGENSLLEILASAEINLEFSETESLDNEKPVGLVCVRKNNQEKYRAAIQQFRKKLSSEGIIPEGETVENTIFNIEHNDRELILEEELIKLFYGENNTIKLRREFLEKHLHKQSTIKLSRDEKMVLHMMQQDLCCEEFTGVFHLYAKASLFRQDDEEDKSFSPLFKARSHEFYFHAMASDFFLQSADWSGVPADWYSQNLQAKERWLRATDNFPKLPGVYSEIGGQRWERGRHYICRLETSLFLQLIANAGEENFYPNIDFMPSSDAEEIVEKFGELIVSGTQGGAHVNISIGRGNDDVVSDHLFEWSDGFIYCDGYPVESQTCTFTNDENFVRFFGRKQRQMQLAGPQAMFNCEELEATVTVRRDRSPCLLALEFDGNQKITVGEFECGNLHQVCGENLKAMPIPSVFKGDNYDIWWTGKAGKYLICRGGTFTPQYLIDGKEIMPLECSSASSKTYTISSNRVLISSPNTNHPLHASMIYWQAFSGENGGPIVEIDPDKKISRVLFPGHTYDGSIPLAFSVAGDGSASLCLVGRPEITLAPRDIGRASIDSQGNAKILAHRPPFNAKGVLVLRDARHPCRYELMTGTERISFYARDSLTISDTYYSGTQEGWLELACLAFEDKQLEEVPQFLERARTPSGQYPSSKAEALLRSLRQAAFSMEQSLDPQNKNVGLLLHWHINFREIADTDGRNLASANITEENLIAELKSLASFSELCGHQRSSKFKMPIDHIGYMLAKITYQLGKKNSDHQDRWVSFKQQIDNKITDLKKRELEQMNAGGINDDMAWHESLKVECHSLQKEQYEVWEVICDSNREANDKIGKLRESINNTTVELAKAHGGLEEILNGSHSYARGIRVQDAVNALHLIRFDSGDSTSQHLGQFWSAIKGLNFELNPEVLKTLLPKLIKYLTLRAKLNYEQVACEYLEAHSNDSFSIDRPPRLLSVSRPPEDENNPNFRNSALGLVWLLLNAEGDRRLTTMQMETIVEITSGNHPTSMVTWPTGSGKSSDGIPTMLSIMLCQKKIPCVVVPGEQLASMSGDLDEAMRQRHWRVVNLPGLLSFGGKKINWLSTFTQNPEDLRLLLENLPVQGVPNDAALLLSYEMYIRIFDAFSTAAHRCMTEGGQRASPGDRDCFILLTRIVQRLTDYTKLFDEAASIFDPNQSFTRADSDGEMAPPPQPLISCMSDFFLALVDPEAAMQDADPSNPSIPAALIKDLKNAQVLCDFTNNGHISCDEATICSKVINPLSQFALHWILKQYSPPLIFQDENILLRKSFDQDEFICTRENFLNYLRGASSDDLKSDNSGVGDAADGTAKKIHGFFMEACRINPSLSSCWEDIAMVRGLLHDVLPQSLQKKIYDSYGPSADNSRQVVAYHNGESTASEPSFLPLKTALFFQTIAKEGLTKTLWKEYLKSASHSVSNDAAHGNQGRRGFEELFEEVTVDGQSMTLSLALQEPEKCYESARSFFGKRRNLPKLFTIARLVANKQLVQPLHAFESRMGSLMDLCSGQNILFTATPLPSFVLPPAFSSLVTDEGENAPEAEGKRIEEMKRTCRFDERRCTFHRVGSLTLDNLLKSAVHPGKQETGSAAEENVLEKLSAIIDLSGDAASAVGGNDKLALLLRKKLSDQGIHRHIIFPRDTDGLWQILSVDGNLLPPFEGSGDALSLKGINSENGEYVFIYSKSKSVGTNFPWPRRGFAIMTSDPNTDSSATIIQAVGRARNGQPVAVCVRGTGDVDDQDKEKLDFCKRALELQKNLDSKRLRQQAFGSLRQIPKMIILRQLLDVAKTINLSGEDVLGTLVNLCEGLFDNAEAYFRATGTLKFTSLYGEPFAMEKLKTSVDHDLEALGIAVEKIKGNGGDPMPFFKDRSDAITKAINISIASVGEMEIRSHQFSQNQDGEVLIDSEQQTDREIAQDREREEEGEKEANQFSEIPRNIERLSETEQKEGFTRFSREHTDKGIIVKGQQLSMDRYEQSMECNIPGNLSETHSRLTTILASFPNIRMSWGLVNQHSHRLSIIHPLEERPKYAIRYFENYGDPQNRKLITVFISEKEAKIIQEEIIAENGDQFARANTGGTGGGLRYLIGQIVGTPDGTHGSFDLPLGGGPVAIFSAMDGRMICPTKNIEDARKEILEFEELLKQQNGNDEYESKNLQTQIDDRGKALDEFSRATGEMMLVSAMLRGDADGILRDDRTTTAYRNFLQKIGNDIDLSLHFIELNARILRTSTSADNTDRQLAQLKNNLTLTTGIYLTREFLDVLRANGVEDATIQQLLSNETIFTESALRELCDLDPQTVLLHLPAPALRKIFSEVARKGNPDMVNRFRCLLGEGESSFRMCDDAIGKREAAKKIIRENRKATQDFGKWVSDTIDSLLGSEDSRCFSDSQQSLIFDPSDESGNYKLADDERKAIIDFNNFLTDENMDFLGDVTFQRANESRFFNVWKIISKDKETEEFLLSIICGCVASKYSFASKEFNEIFGKKDIFYVKKITLAAIAAFADDVRSTTQGLVRNDPRKYSFSHEGLEKIVNFFSSLLFAGIYRIKVKNEIIKAGENTNFDPGNCLRFLRKSEELLCIAISEFGLGKFMSITGKFDANNPLSLFDCSTKAEPSNFVKMLLSYNGDLWKMVENSFAKGNAARKLITYLQNSDTYDPADTSLYRCVFEGKTKRNESFQEIAEEKLLTRRVYLANNLSECALANLNFGKDALSQIFKSSDFSPENISKWPGKTCLLRMFIESVDPELIIQVNFTDNQLINDDVIDAFLKGENKEKLLALLRSRKPSSILALIRGNSRWKETLKALEDDDIESIAKNIADDRESSATKQLMALLFTQEKYSSFFIKYLSGQPPNIQESILSIVDLQFCSEKILNEFQDVLLPFLSFRKLSKFIELNPNRLEELISRSFLRKKIDEELGGIKRRILDSSNSIFDPKSGQILDSFQDGERTYDVSGSLRLIRALAKNYSGGFEEFHSKFSSAHELLEIISGNGAFGNALIIDNDTTWVGDFFGKMEKATLTKVFGDAVEDINRTGSLGNGDLLNLAIAFGNVSYVEHDTTVTNLAAALLKIQNKSSRPKEYRHLVDRFGKSFQNAQYLKIQLQLASNVSFETIFSEGEARGIENHLFEIMEKEDGMSTYLPILRGAAEGITHGKTKGIKEFIAKIKVDARDELGLWFFNLHKPQDENQYTHALLVAYGNLFGKDFSTPPRNKLLQRGVFKLSKTNDLIDYRKFYELISDSNPKVQMSTGGQPSFDDSVLVDSFIMHEEMDVLTEQITIEQIKNSTPVSWGTREFSEFISDKADKSMVVDLFDKATGNVTSDYFIDHIHAFLERIRCADEGKKLAEEQKKKLLEKISATAGQVPVDKIGNLNDEAIAIMLPLLSAEQLHHLTEDQVRNLQQNSMGSIRADQIDGEQYGNGFLLKFLNEGSVDEVAKLSVDAVNAIPNNVVAGITSGRVGILTGPPKLFEKILLEERVDKEIKKNLTSEQLQIIWGDEASEIAQKREVFKLIDGEVLAHWFSELREVNSPEDPRIYEIMLPLLSCEQLHELTLDHVSNLKPNSLKNIKADQIDDKTYENGLLLKFLNEGDITEIANLSVDAANAIPPEVISQINPERVKALTGPPVLLIKILQNGTVDANVKKEFTQDQLNIILQYTEDKLPDRKNTFESIDSGVFIHWVSTFHESKEFFSVSFHVCKIIFDKCASAKEPLAELGKFFPQIPCGYGAIKISFNLFMEQQNAYRPAVILWAKQIAGGPEAAWESFLTNKYGGDEFSLLLKNLECLEHFNYHLEKGQIERFWKHDKLVNFFTAIPVNFFKEEQNIPGALSEIATNEIKKRRHIFIKMLRHEKAATLWTPDQLAEMTNEFPDLFDRGDVAKCIGEKINPSGLTVDAFKDGATNYSNGLMARFLDRGTVEQIAALSENAVKAIPDNIIGEIKEDRVKELIGPAWLLEKILLSAETSWEIKENFTAKQLQVLLKSFDEQKRKEIFESIDKGIFMSWLDNNKLDSEDCPNGMDICRIIFDKCAKKDDAVAELEKFFPKRLPDKIKTYLLGLAGDTEKYNPEVVLWSQWYFTGEIENAWAKFFRSEYDVESFKFLISHDETYFTKNLSPKLVEELWAYGKLDEIFPSIPLEFFKFERNFPKSLTMNAEEEIKKRENIIKNMLAFPGKACLLSGDGLAEVANTFPHLFNGSVISQDIINRIDASKLSASTFSSENLNGNLLSHFLKNGNPDEIAKLNDSAVGKITDHDIDSALTHRFRELVGPAKLLERLLRRSFIDRKNPKTFSGLQLKVLFDGLDLEKRESFLRSISDENFISLLAPLESEDCTNRSIVCDFIFKECEKGKPPLESLGKFFAKDKIGKNIKKLLSGFVQSTANHDFAVVLWAQKLANGPTAAWDSFFNGVYGPNEFFILLQDKECKQHFLENLTEGQVGKFWNHGNLPNFLIQINEMPFFENEKNFPAEWTKEAIKAIGRYPAICSTLIKHQAISKNFVDCFIENGNLSCLKNMTCGQIGNSSSASWRGRNFSSVIKSVSSSVTLGALSEKIIVGTNNVQHLVCHINAFVGRIEEINRGKLVDDESKLVEDRSQLAKKISTIAHKIPVDAVRLLSEASSGILLPSLLPNQLSRLPEATVRNLSPVSLAQLKASQFSGENCKGELMQRFLSEGNVDEINKLEDAVIKEIPRQIIASINQDRIKGLNGPAQLLIEILKTKNKDSSSQISFTGKQLQTIYDNLADDEKKDFFESLKEDTFISLFDALESGDCTSGSDICKIVFGKHAAKRHTPNGSDDALKVVKQFFTGIGNHQKIKGYLDSFLQEENANSCEPVAVLWTLETIYGPQGGSKIWDYFLDRKYGEKEFSFLLKVVEYKEYFNTQLSPDQIGKFWTNHLLVSLSTSVPDDFLKMPKNLPNFQLGYEEKTAIAARRSVVSALVTHDDLPIELVNFFIENSDIYDLRCITKEQIVKSDPNSWRDRDFSIIINAIDLTVLPNLLEKIIPNNSSEHFTTNINALATRMRYMSDYENKTRMVESILNVAGKISAGKIQSLNEAAIEILLPSLVCDQLFGISEQTATQLSGDSIKKLTAAQFNSKLCESRLMERFFMQGNIHEIAKLEEGVIEVIPDGTIALFLTTRNETIEDLEKSPKLLLRIFRTKTDDIYTKKRFKGKQLQIIWNNLGDTGKKDLFESIDSDVFASLLGALESEDCTSGSAICKIVFDKHAQAPNSLEGLKPFFENAKTRGKIKTYLSNFLRDADDGTYDPIAILWTQQIIFSQEGSGGVWDYFLNGKYGKDEFSFLITDDECSKYFNESLSPEQAESFWKHENLENFLPNVPVNFFDRADNLPGNWTEKTKQVVNSATKTRNAIIPHLLKHEKALNLWSSEELVQVANDFPESFEQLCKLSQEQISQITSASIGKIRADQIDFNNSGNDLLKRFILEGNVNEIASLKEDAVNAIPSESIREISLDRFKALLGPATLLVKFFQQNGVAIEIKQSVSGSQLQTIWNGLESNQSERKTFFESIGSDLFISWLHELEKDECINRSEICKIIFDKCEKCADPLAELKKFFPENENVPSVRGCLADFVENANDHDASVVLWVQCTANGASGMWESFTSSRYGGSEFSKLLTIDVCKKTFTTGLSADQIEQFWSRDDLGALLTSTPKEFFQKESNLPNQWPKEAKNAIRNEDALVPTLLSHRKALYLWSREELVEMANKPPNPFNREDVAKSIIGAIDASKLKVSAFIDGDTTHSIFLKSLSSNQIYAIPPNLFDSENAKRAIGAHLLASQFSESVQCPNGFANYFLRHGPPDEIAKLSEQQADQFQDGDYAAVDAISLRRLFDSQELPKSILHKIFQKRNDLREHFKLPVLTKLHSEYEDLFSEVGLPFLDNLMNSTERSPDDQDDEEVKFCSEQCQKRFDTIFSAGFTGEPPPDANKILAVFPRNKFGGKWLLREFKTQFNDNPSSVSNTYKEFMENNYGFRENKESEPPNASQLSNGQPPSSNPSPTTENLSSLKTACIVVGVIAGVLAFAGAVAAILFFAGGLIPVFLAGFLSWQIAAMLFAPTILFGTMEIGLLAAYFAKKKSAEAANSGS